jgi:hypothetical protein
MDMVMEKKRRKKNMDMGEETVFLIIHNKAVINISIS